MAAIMEIPAPDNDASVKSLGVFLANKKKEYSDRNSLSSQKKAQNSETH